MLFVSSSPSNIFNALGDCDWLYIHRIDKQKSKVQLGMCQNVVNDRFWCWAQSTMVCEASIGESKTSFAVCNSPSPRPRYSDSVVVISSAHWRIALRGFRIS